MKCTFLLLLLLLLLLLKFITRTVTLIKHWSSKNESEAHKHPCNYCWSSALYKLSYVIIVIKCLVSGFVPQALKIIIIIIQQIVVVIIIIIIIVIIWRCCCSGDTTEFGGTLVVHGQHISMLCRHRRLQRHRLQVPVLRSWQSPWRHSTDAVPEGFCLLFSSYLAKSFSFCSKFRRVNSVSAAILLVRSVTAGTLCVSASSDDRVAPFACLR